MPQKTFVSRLWSRSTSSRPIHRVCLSLLIILVTVFLPAALKPLQATGTFVSGVSSAPVTVVSAASYGGTLAPDSIASAFGEKLATQTLAAMGDADPNTPGVQLPTQLGGTTVEIGGQRAGLFFVSPGQINFALPASAPAGDATVIVRSGDGTVSMGTLKVELVAPALFTANADGAGVPAAVLLRVAADGKQTFEPVAQLNAATGKFAPRLLNWTSPAERLFLILYLSGLRGAVDVNGDGNLNETVHLLLGGQEIEPSFAGKAPDFAGLDQLNAEIPRSLSGRGLVDLAVSFSTQAASNVARIEVGGAPPPISVSGFSPATALVGDEITISGAGFSSNPNDNQAFFISATPQPPLRAKLNSAASGQLKVVVPFGAGTGRIMVRSPQNEALSAAQLSLRTSISGFLETTKDNPLPGVTVKLRESNISVVTDAEGKFILPDVPPGNRREFVIDTSSLPRSLPFPVLTGSLRVNAGRDHHLDRISLQQATGPSISFNSTSSLAANSFAPETSEGLAAFAPARSIQTGGVTFEVDDNASAIFSNGATSGEVFLTVVENSRAPVKLPPGVFSSTIVQLTPLGVRLSPGGRLTFPNTDNLAANAQARLYRLDQTSGSATLGQFVEAGAAQVTADGRTVATAPNAVAETSYYFVAIPRPTTTLVGRVVDSDGATPVGEAFVRSRGQSASTDSLGGFVLRGVPASGANDLLTVEASYQRPGGRVDRVQRNGIAPVLNGVTRVTPDLVLPSPATAPNRPPTLTAPPSLSVTEGATLNYGFLASDPDSGQTIQVSVSGAAFASVSQVSGSSYNLRLTPGAGAAGNYTLIVRATDNLGASAAQNIALTVFANRPPVLSVPGAQTAIPGQTLSFNINVADPDEGQTLTFNAANLPSGATLTPTGATSARFLWTPGTNQVGNFVVSLTVSDNGAPVLSDTKTVTIVVTGTTQWAQTAGPYGGIVLALLPRGGTLFAGTNGGGVFRSTDNGANWTAVNNGLGNQSVYALAVSGTSLFAGTFDNGVFRSTDDGANWTAVNNGLNNRDVSALVISGTNLFAGTRGGIYRSTDSGANWTVVNNGLGGQFVYCLAVSSTTLFAGTRDNGVFRSTDNGASWTAVNNGLESQEVFSLTVNGTTLFAGTEEGVFRSTNSGANWTAVKNGMGNRFVYSLAVSGTTLFAGTSGSGVFRSTDNGANWTAVNNGLSHQDVFTVAVSGMTLFAGTRGGGIFRSTDNGASWTAVNNGLVGNTIYALALSGASLFAGTGGGGVFRSTDNGTSWTAVNNGLGNQFVFSLVVSGGSLFAGTFDNGVFRSTDNGAGWTAINNGLGNQSVYSLAVSGTILFAGTRGGGIFRSTDNGANWTVVNNGLGNQFVYALVVNGTILFAGTIGNGVFRSTDNGTNWTAVNNGLGNQSVSSLAVSGASLFAGTLGGGVFRSTDNGASWTTASNGLGNQSVSSLAVKGTILFAGTFGNGVFRSTDNGTNWTAFNEGLTNFNVSAFAMTGDNLFAGTLGNSIFVRRSQ